MAATPCRVGRLGRCCELETSWLTAGRRYGVTATRAASGRSLDTSGYNGRGDIWTRFGLRRDSVGFLVRGFQRKSQFINRADALILEVRA